MGIGAAAAAFGGAGLRVTPAAAQAVTDADILNFALNLEYLEADFFLLAAYGTTLQALSASNVTGVGTLGSVTGGSLVPFVSPYIRDYAEEMAGIELLHVQFLRAALGSAAVAQPAIDFSQSFTTLARAAGVVSASQTFNPFLTDESFLIGAYIFQDVGVTAYRGAAPLLTSKTNLANAAGLLAAEAYQAAIARTKLFEAGLYQITDQISLLRAELSGTGDDIGVSPDGNYPTLVPVDQNALAFARDTSQVLNIVYGGGAPSNYLFFPNKLNGTIS